MTASCDLVIRTLRGADMRVAVGDDAFGLRHVAVEGELDMGTAGLLDAALRDCSDSVLVDVRGVTFCDVVGINVLLNASRRLASDGRTLRLIDVPPRLHRLLTLLDLARELDGDVVDEWDRAFL